MKIKPKDKIKYGIEKYLDNDKIEELHYKFLTDSVVGKKYNFCKGDIKNIADTYDEFILEKVLESKEVTLGRLGHFGFAYLAEHVSSFIRRPKGTTVYDDVEVETGKMIVPEKIVPKFSFNENLIEEFKNTTSVKMLAKRDESMEAEEIKE